MQLLAKRNTTQTIDLANISKKRKENDMGVKKYLMPNGRTVIFEYDENGIGKVTVEAMDALMEMIGAKEIVDDSNT